MTTFVALLRGINVSGQKQIRMVDLQKSCEGLGLKDVRTYLQSGNVVFCKSRADPRKLAAALRTRVAKDFGHDVEVPGLAGEGAQCRRRFQSAVAPVGRRRKVVSLYFPLSACLWGPLPKTQTSGSTGRTGGFGRAGGLALLPSRVRKNKAEQRFL